MTSPLPHPAIPNPRPPSRQNPSQPQPSYLMFAQHGWADTNTDIQRWANALADTDAVVIAPNLGFWRTWWRMAPLVDEVDRIASAWHQRYPTRPKRIVGHSMGGLIWLEVLNRHPDWWPTVERLSLVGSPVGGSDLGRILDPFGWGLGVAPDLGRNRRPLAEKIAQGIPTQIVTSNFDGGSDGTVPLYCSRFRHAQYVELSGIPHDALKRHPFVARVVQHFWQNAPVADASQDLQIDVVIAQLQSVPGMTDAHERDFAKSHLWARLPNSLSLRTWVNPFGVHHVFLADRDNRCRFAGFVGWIHTAGLYQTLQAINVALTDE
ncbi:MAG: alpha/beta hydrolase [Cyanobacteria bacterium J06628_6]